MKWTNKVFRLCLLLPLLGWGYQIFWGDLGAEPAKELNHQTGLTALVYLFLNLALGGISSLVKFPPKMRFLLQERRWLGVLCWVFLLGHFFLYFALEAFEAKAWSQIFGKTYLTFGFFALLGMTVLAVTSNQKSVKMLGGKRWKLLHRSVYFISILVTLHVFSIEKADLLLFAMITVPVWILEGLRLLKWLSRKSDSPSKNSLG